MKLGLRHSLSKIMGTGVLLLILCVSFLPVAQANNDMMLAFGMWTDQFFIGITRNDGTGALRAISQNGFTLDPYFSPDGRFLYFCDNAKTDFGTVLQLYKIELDTKIISLISDGTAVDEWPVVSPDGKRLAFISRPAAPGKDEDASYRIYLSDIAGKSRQAMGPQGESNQFFPSWSPDGKKIVYTYTRFVLGNQLRIMDLGKKESINLLPFYIFAIQGTWSPRGDLIAYTDVVPVAMKKTIWLVKPDGSDRLQLTEGPDDQDPFWYPDGSKLLFSRKVGEREDGNPKRVICSVDLKTKEVKTIVSVDNGSLDTPRIIASPAGSVKPQVSEAPAPVKH